MEAQRERARAASRFGVDAARRHARRGPQPLHRLRGHAAATAPVVALLAGGQRVAERSPRRAGEVVLDRTPFYAESGGQVGDAGELAAGRPASSSRTRRSAARPVHARRPCRRAAADQARDQLERRSMPSCARDRLNHSATHLLHAALRKVLGTHVQQKGSLVSPDGCASTSRTTRR
jgi:alanyl-tRNA synthetase